LPRLPWAIHRDLARLLAGWRRYVKDLGPDAFFFLLLLEGLRLESPKSDAFRYRDVEQILGVSPATIRRWLQTLKLAGLITLEPVPGTNRAHTSFRVHLDGALTRERTDGRVRAVPRGPPRPTAKRPRRPTSRKPR
jgi:hypothetical protein